MATFSTTQPIENIDVPASNPDGVPNPADGNSDVVPYVQTQVEEVIWCVLLILFLCGALFALNLFPCQYSYLDSFSSAHILRAPTRTRA